MAQIPDPRRSIAAAAALVNGVSQHQRGNADDEYSGHDFEYAHMNLFAAVQYGVECRPFKTRSWNIPWNNEGT